MLGVFARLRSLAVVVALVAVVTVGFSATTQDAARAFVPPPVVPVTALALPGAATATSALLFNPVGAVVFGVGVGAFFLLGGDEVVSNLADDAICAVFGGDGCASSTGTGAGPEHKPNGGTRVNFTPEVLGMGPAQNTVGWGGRCQGLNSTGTQLCNGTSSAPYYSNSVPVDTRFEVQCGGGPFSDAQGGVLKAQFGANGGPVNAPRPDGTSASWNVDKPTRDGVPKQVCPPGTEVLSIRWWEIGTNTDVTVVPGSWTSGLPFPEGAVGVRIDTTCERPDGTRYVITGRVTTDKSVAAPNCPAPDSPVGTEVFTGTPGGPMTPRGRTEVTPDARTDYSECLTPQGQTTCSTVVQVDGVPCEVGRADCINWQDIARQTPERVDCMWGPYSMPLSACEPLGEGYWTGTVTPPHPGTPRWTAVNPDGTPAPKPQPGTETPPTDQPGPSPFPQNPPNPNPTAPPGAGGNPTTEGPSPDPDGEGSCWGGMVSWNPLDWVVTPVKCALVWAFVPRPEVLTSTLTAIGTVGPGPWVEAAGDLVEATKFDGRGACAGPTWSFTTPVTGAMSLQPFWACGSPQSVVARVVYIGLTVLVWLGAGIVCVRLVASAFGLNWNGFGGRDGDDA